MRHPSPRWEYIKVPESIDLIVPTLSRLGHDGWELTSIISKDSTDVVMLILKREIAPLGL